MDKSLRNEIANTAQRLRGALEREYLEQLEGAFDVHPSGEIAEEPGQHLAPPQQLARQKIVGAINYHRASGLDAAEAVARGMT